MTNFFQKLTNFLSRPATAGKARPPAKREAFALGALEAFLRIEREDFVLKLKRTNVGLRGFFGVLIHHDSLFIRLWFSNG